VELTHHTTHGPKVALRAIQGLFSKEHNMSNPISESIAAAWAAANRDFSGVPMPVVYHPYTVDPDMRGEEE
jgi:hypothetical protein